MAVKPRVSDLKLRIVEFAEQGGDPSDTDTFLRWVETNFPGTVTFQEENGDFFDKAIGLAPFFLPLIVGGPAGGAIVAEQIFGTFIQLLGNNETRDAATVALDQLARSFQGINASTDGLFDQFGQMVPEDFDLFVPETRLTPEVALGFQAIAPTTPSKIPTTLKEAVPIIIDVLLSRSNGSESRLLERVKGVIDAILRDGQVKADDIDNLVTFSAGGFLDGAATSFDFLGASADGLISGFTNPVNSVVGGTVEKIEQFFTDQFERVTASIEAMVGSVTDSIAEVVASIADFIQQTVGGFVNQIAEALEGAFRGLRDVVTKIILGIVDTLGEVVQKIERAISGLVDTVRGLVEQAADFIKRAIDGIERAIDTGIRSVVSLAETIQEGFRTLIDRLLASSRAILDRLGDVLIGLGEAISESVGGVVKSIEEFIGIPLSELPAGVAEEITKALGVMPPEQVQALSEFSPTGFLSTVTVDEMRAQFRTLFTEQLPATTLGRLALSLFIVPFMAFQLASGVAQAQSQIVLQEFALGTSFQILTVGDSIRALHFGEIDREQAVLNVRRAGFTEDDANRLIDTGETVPQETDLLRWWLRGIIDDAEVDRRFEGRGYSPAERTNFREAAFFIPPVSDLISMAVREAFTPEVAERFGQFEDFPEPFAEAALQQGVSNEWARRYWAAHWGLPSVQMGFEMLHRGVIEEADLNLLLRSQDIMPFWRDKLTAISFSPLTRVDVRRMHKLGVLSRDEVKRSYLDLGYSDENAERLTQFTIELNSPKVAEDDTELSQLSRASIIGLFEDGIINRERAKLLMVGIGVSDDAAELFLESKEMDLERSDRNDQKTLIIEQSRVGQISFQEAQDALAGLGLETVEQERAIVKLVRQEASKTRLPTRANLDNFLEAGLIEDAEYLETMARLGFTRKWSDRFLTIAKG